MDAAAGLSSRRLVSCRQRAPPAVSTSARSDGPSGDSTRLIRRLVSYTHLDVYKRQPIGNATSYTPHRLIREGEAVLVSSVDEVRELIAPLGTVALGRPRAGRLLDTLTDDQRSVYEALPARGGRTCLLYTSRCV